MIIEIEFPIITTGKPVKATKTKTVVFRDVVRVDIPDYGPSAKRPSILVDGPPGFQRTPYYGIEGQLYGATAQRVPRDRRSALVIGLRPSDNVLTHHLESALVDLGKKLRDHHSTAMASALYPNERAEYFAAGFRTTRAAGRLDLNPVVLPTFDQLSVSELDTAEIDRQRAAFADHLAEFAIVDGEFMRTVPEPVYGVTIGYPAHDGVGHLRSEGSAAKVELILPPRGNPLHKMRENVNVVAFFSADRHADALAYANAIKPLQGPGPREAIGAPRRIVVNDAAYVRFDDEAASLKMVAENMARCFLSETLGYRDTHATERVRQAFEDVPMDVLVAWKRLTAAIKGEDMGMLPGAIQDCLDVQEETGTAHFARFAIPATVVEMALAKWDNREVSVSIEKLPEPRRPI